MDKNLALEFVRVTEAAAIEAARWIGKGEGKKADGAAVEAMRKRFNSIDFSGAIVIGEGKKDEAPELFVGEQLGNGTGPEMDIAVDPLECTDSVAFGRYNATTIIATGPKGSLLQAPDTYMNKIAVGPRAKHVIDLNAPVATNIQAVAKALGKDVEELTVSLLERPRHEGLVQEIRAAGARVRLITDGDVAVAVATCMDESPIDMLLGWGGSAESVLAATAVKILGGEFQCSFKPRNDDDRREMAELGLSEEMVFSTEDLAKGDNLTFTATGVIDGPMLEGVIFGSEKIITHSVVMRSVSKTVRYLKTYHNED